MICIGTIARLTREVACNWSSRIATRHAGRAAVGALIGAASGSIMAAGLIFRLAGKPGAVIRFNKLRLPGGRDRAVLPAGERDEAVSQPWTRAKSGVAGREAAQE